MALTKTTDFKGDTALSQSSSDPTLTSDICRSIEHYEPLFMRYALGEDMVQLIGDWEDVSLPQRFVDIRDGVLYTVNGKQIKFDGIKRLVRSYIYKYHAEQLQQSVTPVGIKTERAANAVTGDTSKICRVWNEMSRGMIPLWNMLNNRVDINGDKVYPEWCSCDIHVDAFRSINTFGIG